MRVIIPLKYNFYDEHVLVGKDDIIVNEENFKYYVEIPETYNITSSTYEDLLEEHRKDALYSAAIKTLEDYVDVMYG